MAFWGPWLFNGFWALCVLLVALPQAAAQWSTPQGPYHSPIVTLASDPTSTSVFYAAHGNGGIVKSEDGGLSWASVGPTNLTFRQLVVDPFDPQVLFGIAAGQLFKSSDGGATWNRLGGFIGQALNIGLDPVQPGVAYLVIDRAVVKTADGGATWTEMLRAIAPETVSNITVDAAASNTVYVGGGGGTPVRWSSDGGATWSAAQAGLEGQSVIDIEVDSQRAGSVYAATFTGVFHSSDGGGSWQRSGLATGFVSDVVADPRRADHVMASHRDRGVLQSFDAGATWTGLNGGLEELQIAALLPVQIAPYAWLAATTRNGFFAVGEGESTWSNISHLEVPAKVTALNWSADGEILFAGTDRQGLFTSRDRGQTWQISSSALDGLLIQDLVTTDTPNAPIYAVAPTRVFRSDTAGRTWNELRLNLPRDVAVHGVHLHPQIPNTLFLATSAGVYRSFNGGSTWAQADLADQSVVSVTLDAIQPDIIYAASASGALFKSVDRGIRWDDVSASLAVGAVAHVVADSRVGGRVYVAGEFAGLFASADSGATWTPLNGTLGERTVNRLFPAADGALYAAEQTELSRSRDGGASWVALAVGATGNITASAARSGGLVAVGIDGAGVSVAQFSDTDNGSGGPGGPNLPGGGGGDDGGGAMWLMLVPLAALYGARRAQRKS